MLYGKKSDVNYADNELTAPSIEFDQRTNLVKAGTEERQYRQGDRVSHLRAG